MKGKDTNIYETMLINRCNTFWNGLTDWIFLQIDQPLLVDFTRRMVIFCTLDGNIQKELSLSGHHWSIVQRNDRKEAVVLYITSRIKLHIGLLNWSLAWRCSFIYRVQNRIHKTFSDSLFLYSNKVHLYFWPKVFHIILKFYTYA